MSKKVRKSFFETQLFSTIKLVLLFGVVVFIYGFSAQRNNQRMLLNSKVIFEQNKHLLLSEETVNNLLIQNKGSVVNIKKETLDLDVIEKALEVNPLVREANVYVSVSGEVGVSILQKKPIARVHTNETYYIDEIGKMMPISSNFAVRVPLVTGDVDKKNLFDVYKVLQTISEDPFFSQEIEGIIVAKNRYTLLLREFDFVIDFGTSANRKIKIENFKAFYQKALKDQILNNYSKVNLQIASQVVCTKK